MTKVSKEYQRKWRAAHVEQARAHARKWVRTHKDKARINTVRWQNKQYKCNPEFKKKLLARSSAQYYVPVIECIKCGSKEQLQRHHLDYNKPLEVVILCRLCHNEEHEKKEGQP